jgi:hypothetical protein
LADASNSIPGLIASSSFPLFVAAVVQFNTVVLRSVSAGHSILHHSHWRDLDTNSNFRPLVESVVYIEQIGLARKAESRESRGVFFIVPPWVDRERQANGYIRAKTILTAEKYIPNLLRPSEGLLCVPCGLLLGCSLVMWKMTGAALQLLCRIFHLLFERFDF